MTGLVVLNFITPVSTPAQGTSVIVVINKVGHVIQGFKVDVFGPLVVIVSDVGHVLVVEDSVSDPEEEWVVEDAAD
jgi:hypothetical protein